MLGAAQLEHLERAAPILRVKVVTQDHHVVNDKLLGPVTGDVAAFVRALSHQQRRRAQRPQLAHHRRERPSHLGRGRKTRQQRIDRVKDQPLALNLGQRVTDPRQQPPEIEPAAHDRFRIRRRVNDHQPPILHQAIKVPSEALRVGDQIIRALRERHQHARLAELPRAARQELKAKHRLTGPRPARQQRRSTPRQPAQSQRIETRDANLNTLQTPPLPVVP